MARVIDDRFTYLQTTEMQLGEIDECIEELRARAEHADAAERAEWHGEIQALEDCRRHALERIRELRHTSAEHWPRVRPHVEEVWVEIKQAVEHARWGF